jgi:CTP:molybdopterin cytidylyltransferase MocA
MMSCQKISALILAAGRSARMGEFKPLLKCRGLTFIETLTAAYRSAGIWNILVVLGHRADELKPLLDAHHVSWIVNERYDQGMFSSIQTGVKRFGADCAAFFLQPADMPLIRPETLSILLRAHDADPTRICYPCHNGRRGHPPLIPVSLIPAIETFSEPGGMRALLARFAGLARNVDIPDPGILVDIDTPDDYRTIPPPPPMAN